MDILVDSLKKLKIPVWDGCDATIQRATETFSEQLTPYSIESRKHSLYRLFRETIDPIWGTYVNSLQSNFLAHSLLRDLSPSEFASENGVRAFEDRIRNLIRSYHSLSELAEKDIDKGLVATLETMRELAKAAQLKRPKRKSIGINLLRLRRTVCEFCGNQTELTERHQKGELFGNARFSSRFCVTHRPWNHDGSYNSAYKRAARNKKKIEQDLLRLTLQASNISELCAQTGDHAIDLFILDIVARRARYPDEESALRNIAYRLNKEKVSDNKKRIVILLASGMNQSEAASYLGISRQAVSKAVNSIPSEYRFDINKTYLLQFYLTGIVGS